MEEPMELSYFDLLFTDTVVLMLIWVFSEEIDILEFGHFQFNKYFGVFCNSHLPDMQFEKSRPIFRNAFSNADLKWAH